MSSGSMKLATGMPPVSLSVQRSSRPDLMLNEYTSAGERAEVKLNPISRPSSRQATRLGMPSGSLGSRRALPGVASIKCSLPTPSSFVMKARVLPSGDSSNSSTVQAILAVSERSARDFRSICTSCWNSLPLSLVK